MSANGRGPIRVLLVEPGKACATLDVEPTLREFQRLVGGCYRQVRLKGAPLLISELAPWSMCAIACREDAELFPDIQLNRRGLGLVTRLAFDGDIVRGPFLIYRLGRGGEESLTPEHIEKWSRYFNQPRVRIP